MSPQVRDSITRTVEGWIPSAMKAQNSQGNGGHGKVGTKKTGVAEGMGSQVTGLQRYFEHGVVKAMKEMKLHKGGSKGMPQ